MKVITEEADNKCETVRKLNDLLIIKINEKRELQAKIKDNDNITPIPRISKQNQTSPHINTSSKRIERKDHNQNIRSVTSNPNKRTDIPEPIEEIPQGDNISSYNGHNLSNYNSNDPTPSVSRNGSTTGQNPDSTVRAEELREIKETFLEAIDRIMKNNSQINSVIREPISRPAVPNRLKPECFEGKTSEAMEWLADFNNIAENNQWSDDQKIRSARICLKGNAKNWYLRTFPDPNDPDLSSYTTPPIPTFQEFVIEFKKHFRPKGSNIVMERQLPLQRKSKDETYIDYLYRFLIMARRADPKMEETRIIFIFRETLEKDPIIHSLLVLTKINDIELQLRAMDDLQSRDKILEKTVPTIGSTSKPHT